jgi:predicted P-loop ATPase/GTPase
MLMQQKNLNKMQEINQAVVVVVVKDVCSKVNAETTIYNTIQQSNKNPVTIFSDRWKSIQFLIYRTKINIIKYYMSTRIL